MSTVITCSKTLSLCYIEGSFSLLQLKKTIYSIAFLYFLCENMSLLKTWTWDSSIWVISTLKYNESSLKSAMSIHPAMFYLIYISDGTSSSWAWTRWGGTTWAVCQYNTEWTIIHTHTNTYRYFRVASWSNLLAFGLLEETVAPRGNPSRHRENMQTPER